ncbi:MAG: ion transporter [Rhizobiaceae bacterium]
MEQETIKKRIGNIIWGQDARFGSAFDQAMIIVILFSIGGMALATVPGLPSWAYRLLDALDFAVLILFTLEYLLRLWTARSAWRYARSGWGIIDLAAILPFWLTFGGNFQALRSLRLLRILRIGKLARHVAALDRIARTFQLIKEELVVFGFLALIVMFIAAVGIYEFEHEAQPQAFASIPHALWFVVVTLTTVGYGDVYPVTAGGRFFTFFILIIGLGVIAVPTGLISSGLSRAREEEKEKKRARVAKDADRTEA